jgi:hypothetical protein
VPAAIGKEDKWIAERLADHRKIINVSEQLLSYGRWVKISELITSDVGIVGIRTDISELREKQSKAKRKAPIWRNLSFWRT